MKPETSELRGQGLRYDQVRAARIDLPKSLAGLDMALMRLRHPKLAGAWRAAERDRLENGRGPALILLGFPGSGNTWIRFFYHNYALLLSGRGDVTLKFGNIDTINPNQSFPSRAMNGSYDAPPADLIGICPVMYNTHKPWRAFWGKFGRTVYVHRHPLDAMLSVWRKRIKNTGRDVIDARSYLLENIASWCALHRRALKGADLILRYETLRADPDTGFRSLLALAGVPVRDDLMADAIQRASFDRISKTETDELEKEGRRTGKHNWKDGARFTASGEEGQWRAILKPEDVPVICRTIEDWGLDVPDDLANYEPAFAEN